jgi:hypothetical protein
MSAHYYDDHSQYFLFEYVVFYVDKLNNHKSASVHNNDCPGCASDPPNPALPSSGDGSVRGWWGIRY